MSTQITVRFDITADALKTAFPNAKNITLNSSGKTATVEFASAADAKQTADVASFVCPISQRPQVVYCKPDVTTQAVDASKLVVYTDVTTKSGGRVYKNADIDSKHVASLKFTPLVNSVILAPMDFGTVQIQVSSIIVSPEQDGKLSCFMKVYHKESGRSGTCIFKRSVDAATGQVKFSRRCFDLLANKDDYKQSNDTIVPINFISIESITVDPSTGLWSELKISLDKTEAKLSLFRLGSAPTSRGRGPFRGVRSAPGPRRVQSRRFGSGPRSNTRRPARPRAQQQQQQPQQPQTQ